MQPQKTFLLLLAPSGAGKTTRIKTYDFGHAGTVHIERDAITSDLLVRHGIDVRFAGAEDKERINRILDEEAKPAYYARLEEELGKDATQKIIVDYPPGGTGDWIAKSISLARAAGYRVEVEGITVDPAESLNRVLCRQMEGAPEDRVSEGIASYQAQFKNWLSTYQKFPGQLAEAAALADEMRLFDNNDRSFSPVLVAEDKGQGLCILDQGRYDGFLKLKKLNTDAGFTARMESVTREGGKMSYRFSSVIDNLYLSPGQKPGYRPEPPAAGAISSKS